MEVKIAVDVILRNDALDSDDAEKTKCECIESIIPMHGWETIQAELIEILLDNNRRKGDWETIARVIWGAALDKREINENCVIALLYFRLCENGRVEDNLAWSIASKLKNKEYLSEYNPMTDPEVIAEQKRMQLI